MSRVYVRSDQSFQVLTAKSGACQGIALKVIDPITIWISNNRTDVDDFNSATQSANGGLPIQQIDPVLIIGRFVDDLFIRASAPGHIELQIYMAG